MRPSVAPTPKPRRRNLSRYRWLRTVTHHDTKPSRRTRRGDTGDGGPARIDVIVPRWARRRGPFGVTLRGLCAVLAVVLIGAPTAVGTAAATYMWAPLPAELPELDALTENRASVVLAADGTPMTSFEPDTNQVLLDADDIPENVTVAVLAAEDARFYDHTGVDPIGLIRAAWTNLRGGTVTQGGSTITQQVIKNRTGDDEATYARKLREALDAIRLERTVDKDEILADYLNIAFFGEGATGIEAAAQTYLAKPAAELTLSEAAWLAGIIPAPSRYNPRVDPQRTEQRRLLVLDRIEAAGLTTRADVNAARAQVPTVVEHETTPSTHPYFTDWVKRWLTDEAGIDARDVHNGGLVIVTTLDPRVQAAAEDVAVAALPNPDVDPDTAIVSVEPGTGAVRALVGGRDHNVSEVNYALGRDGGGSGRQPGSAFKPFVYAAALEAGRTPNSRYPAPACTTPEGFTAPVCNASGRGYGNISLNEAMRISSNTAYVNAITDVGVQRTAELANRLGVTSIDATTAVGGIAIGSTEVAPIEMAGAYATFAAGGLYAEPTPVSQVFGPDGTVLYDIADEHPTRVLTSDIALEVNAALGAVIADGTGRDADIGRPAAGKTGTTNDYTNAWFVGHTPQLATAVWVGHPEGNIPLLNVAGVAKVGGGTIPAAIWRDYMRRALEGVEPLGLDQVAIPTAAFERPTYVHIGPGDRKYPEPPPPPPTVPFPTTTTEARPTTSTTELELPEVTLPPATSTTTTTTSPATTTTTAPTTTTPPTTTSTTAPTTTVPTTTTTSPDPAGP